MLEEQSRHCNDVQTHRTEKVLAQVPVPGRRERPHAGLHHAASIPKQEKDALARPERAEETALLQKLLQARGVRIFEISGNQGEVLSAGFRRVLQVAPQENEGVLANV